MVAALKARELRRVDLTTSPLQQESLLVEQGERMRDVRLGPDGYLYILTDSKNGQVLRLKPEEQ